MKARDLHLDTLKGVLIILVILGHVITRVDGSHFSQRLYDFIYFFHMPLFDRFDMPVDHIVFSIIYTLIILGASLLVCIPFRR